MNTSNITVDEIGNMLTYKGVNYQWNGRQLLSMSTDELVLSYEYNMDGQRVKKTLSAPTGEVAYTYEYFYCGDILAGEIFTANPEYFDADSYVLTYMFDESGDYFGFTYNGTPYYYVKNLQNDVYLIIDENGVAQVLYQYDAWGNVVGGYDASADGLGAVNPITYRSYHYEHETGYYFLTTRYYSPELHRFINADDIGYAGASGTVLSNNLFAYCENSPIIFVDSEGTVITIGAFFAAVGIVVTAVVASVCVSVLLDEKPTVKSTATDVAVTVVDNKVKGTGKVVGLIKFGNTVNSIDDELRAHAENVVNANYANHLNINFSTSSFNESIFSSYEKYIEHCKTTANGLSQHTLYVLGFSIDGKQWNDLTLEQQNKITNSMKIWDTGACFDIHMYCAVHSLFDLFAWG